MVTVQTATNYGAGNLHVSQMSTTLPYPEPVESSPHWTHSMSSGTVLISYHLRLSLPNGLWPSCFRNKILHWFLTSYTYITSKESDQKNVYAKEGRGNW